MSHTPRGPNAAQPSRSSTSTSSHNNPSSQPAGGTSTPRQPSSSSSTSQSQQHPSSGSSLSSIPSSSLSASALNRSRQYTHLHAQLATLNAQVADLEQLLGMTAVQAEYVRGLGGWWGGGYMAASRILGEAEGGAEGASR